MPVYATSVSANRILARCTIFVSLQRVPCGLFLEWYFSDKALVNNRELKNLNTKLGESEWKPQVLSYCRSVKDCMRADHASFVSFLKFLGMKTCPPPWELLLLI